MRSGLFRNPFMPVSESLPTVSILIAARNEETTILNCLRAIDQLDYPADRVEVLIGNDQSTDQTAPLVTTFIGHKPTYQLIDITNNVANLHGKANVLAQLAKRAQGQFLFFTDADTQVPPSWLRGILQAFQPLLHQHAATGIVTGVTLPTGPRLFHKLQGIDWLYNLALTHLLSRLEIPTTAMGNNMAVRRDAYEAVGGYEALPFSVVEDYALFQAVVGEGYGFRNLLSPDVVAETRPVDTLAQWLEQRNRWMRGATSLPGWLVLPLYVQYLVAPLLLCLALLSPKLAIGLYVARLLIQTGVALYSLHRLRRLRNWPYIFLFEGYQLLLGPLAVVAYMFRGEVNWKGRRF